MIARFALTLAVLALIGCDAGRASDPAVWKRDGGKSYESVRPSMIGDFRRQYPAGSDRSRIDAALGPSEASFSGICDERPSADNCSFYYIGANGVDPIVFVVGFHNNKTVAYWKREL